MPSFDAVSEIDRHELTNAIDQANRELKTRFDFRNIEASFELDDEKIMLRAPEDFHLEQMRPILREKLVKREIDPRCLGDGNVEGDGRFRRETLKLRLGLDQDTAKKMVKLIKDGKFKVQASIQGDKVRVNGKKRDDLQEVIAALRKDETLGVPLQFNNFKD